MTRIWRILTRARQRRCYSATTAISSRSHASMSSCLHVCAFPCRSCYCPLLVAWLAIPRASNTFSATWHALRMVVGFRAFYMQSFQNKLTSERLDRMPDIGAAQAEPAHEWLSLWGHLNERQVSARSDSDSSTAYSTSLQDLRRHSHAWYAGIIRNADYHVWLRQTTSQRDSGSQRLQAPCPIQESILALCTEWCVRHTTEEVPHRHWLQHEWQEHLHSIDCLTDDHGTSWMLGEVAIWNGRFSWEFLLC